MGKIINADELPDFFDVATLGRVLDGRSKRSIRYSLGKLLSEHKLFKVDRHFYTKSGDPFFVATLACNGYIGLSSALFILGLKEEMDADVYVCTNTYKRPFRFLDKKITPINVSNFFWGTTIVEKDGREILVSTLPKTIFDMLYRVKYADFQYLYRALGYDTMKKKDWEELLGFITDSNTTVIRRTGHLLDGIAPGWFVSKLKEMSDKAKGVSFFYGHVFDNYDSNWKIFDGLNVTRWKNGIRF